MAVKGYVFSQWFMIRKSIETDLHSTDTSVFSESNLLSLPFQRKKELLEQGNEAVTNDTVASAYIETKGLQLFLFADREDRAANFDEWVTAEILHQSD